MHGGDHGRARTLFGEALEAGRELGDKMMLAECLEGLAGVAAARGDADRTARLWGAAEALRAEIAVRVFDSDLPLHEPHRAYARSRLDAAAFEDAFEAGRAMPQEEAIAYALGDEDRAAGP